MSGARIIERLDKVREVAPQRWIALCPAHEDRGPSLSLRELADGRVLVHCFAGCDASDVLAAVGLRLSDLYPAPPTDHAKPTRPNHFHASREALRVLHFEVLLAAVAAGNMAQGIVLDPEDRARLVLAAGRIRNAAEVCA